MTAVTTSSAPKLATQPHAATAAKEVAQPEGLATLPSAGIRAPTASPKQPLLQPKGLPGMPQDLPVSA